MCYVHVTALVAEYLTRKGKEWGRAGKSGGEELHTPGLAGCFIPSYSI